MPRRRTRRSWAGSLRLSLLLSILVGINVYVFFYRPGTSLRDVLKAQAVEGDPDAGRSAGAPARPVPSSPRRIDGRLASGEPLGAILRRHGMPSREVDSVVRAIESKCPRRRTRGDGVTAYSLIVEAGGQLRLLELRAGSKKTCRIERSASGLRVTGP